MEHTIALPVLKLLCSTIARSFSLQYGNIITLKVIGAPLMEQTMKTGFTLLNGNAVQSTPGQEVRCAVRFPLQLPVLISAGEREHSAITRNVSASGVLFELGEPIGVGEDIRFSLRMPGEVLGTTNDVLVDCCGRVVRCSMSPIQAQVAATIDDYRFVEQ